jgi:hypothetical protein
LNGRIKTITGTFKLSRLPTGDEASVIRKELGLKKKPILSDEDRSKRREQLHKNVATSISKSDTEVSVNQ